VCHTVLFHEPHELIVFSESLVSTIPRFEAVDETVFLKNRAHLYTPARGDKVEVGIVSELYKNGMRGT